MRASRVHLPPTSLLAFFRKAGGVACVPYKHVKEQVQNAFRVHFAVRRIAVQPHGAAHHLYDFTAKDEALMQALGCRRVTREVLPLCSKHLHAPFP